MALAAIPAAMLVGVSAQAGENIIIVPISGGSGFYNSVTVSVDHAITWGPTAIGGGNQTTYLNCDGCKAGGGFDTSGFAGTGFSGSFAYSSASGGGGAKVWGSGTAVENSQAGSFAMSNGFTHDLTLEVKTRAGFYPGNFVVVDGSD